MNPNRLIAFLRGLAILTLMMSTTPVAAGPPRFGKVGSLSTFTHMDLVANIETVGVVVSGNNLPGIAELQLQQSSETTWHSAHPLMRNADGHLVGSLFGLSPNTSYNIRVTDGINKINGVTATQPDELPFTPTTILHVSASAPAGGNGSAAAPFRTIQEGVNHAVPGTQVLVADGLYHEAVSFPASGISGHWIQVKAQGSGAILDGSDNGANRTWTLIDRRKHIYATKTMAPISYLARDQKRFYAFDDYKGLTQGFGHNQVPMAEGWYFDANSSTLFIRSLDNPAHHTWQIPILNHAFDAAGRDWLWIEGFEMRFYGTRTDGCGVCTTNASHVVIRKNKIHNLQLGIFINWTGGEGQGNDTRIEYNEIFDPTQGQWAWKAVKGTTMEGTAIVVRGHGGAIVRDNELHDLFNGIYSGSSAAPENSDIAFDADIYNNHIHNIGDDALEPEGACINQRFRNNTVDMVLDGVSLAPITKGPVWVLRTTFTNYSGKAFKWDGNSDGIVLVYHNTSWTNAADVRAMDVISPVHNAVLRNNIFQGKGYGVEEQAKGSSGNDWNYDDWYTTRPLPHFKWENLYYDNLKELCAGVGFECNGVEKNPGLTDPKNGNFTLLSSSPNIDRGVVIPGIDDGYAGKAPDVGAFEYGQSPASSGNMGMTGVTRVYADDIPGNVLQEGTFNVDIPSVIYLDAESGKIPLNP